jgi:ferritin-like metal-binding protein YciE
MAEKKLREMFHETLKDIYFAEKKILTPCDAILGIIEAGHVEAA